MSPGEQETSSATRRPARSSVSRLIGVRPLRSAKAADQIVEYFRSAIAAGRLKRGDRLPNERQLASEFEVSQPTIREAIRVLEAMGLVEVRHGSGAYVAANSQFFVSSALSTLIQIENVGISDVVDLRLAVAPYSASRAAKYATPEDLAAIEDLEAQVTILSKNSDFEDLAPVALALLSSVAAASHHPLLFAIESFLNQLTIAFLIDASRADPDGFSERWRSWSQPMDVQRRRLLAALRKGDEVAAADAMAAHIEYQVRIVHSFPELAKMQMSDRHVVQALSHDALRAMARRPS